MERLLSLLFALLIAFPAPVCAGIGGRGPQGSVGLVDAKYIVQQADDTLSAEQALGALATGLMRSTNGTGVVDIVPISSIGENIVGDGNATAVRATIGAYGPGDTPSFEMITTGPGATEVHLQDQNLRTTDDVEFNSVNATTFRGVSSANPQTTATDSDCGDNETGFVIDVNATETGSGAEDYQARIRAQRDGTMTTFIDIDAENDALKLGASGVIVKIISETALPPIILAEPDQLQPISDAWPLYHFPAESYPDGVTIKSIHIATSATCTDVLNFEEWSNNGTAWAVDATTEAITLSGTYTQDDGTLSDASYDADDWMYVDLPASPTNIAYWTITITIVTN